MWIKIIFLDLRMMIRIVSWWNRKTSSVRGSARSLLLDGRTIFRPPRFEIVYVNKGRADVAQHLLATIHPVTSIARAQTGRPVFLFLFFRMLNIEKLPPTPQMFGCNNDQGSLVYRVQSCTWITQFNIASTILRVSTVTN